MYKQQYVRFDVSVHFRQYISILRKYSHPHRVAVPLLVPLGSRWTAGTASHIIWLPSDPAWSSQTASRPPQKQNQSSNRCAFVARRSFLRSPPFYPVSSSYPFHSREQIFQSFDSCLSELLHYICPSIISSDMAGNNSCEKASSAQRWNSLDPKSFDRRLAGLGLYRNRPGPTIICRQCQYAIQASGEAVARHLWEKHQVPPDVRKGLTSFVKSLHLPDPNRLSCRPDASSPHPYLTVQRGTACRHCSFRSTSMNLIHRHLSKAHGQKPDQQTWLRELVHEDLGPQSWTRNGPREYWIVTNEERPDLTIATAVTAAKDASYSPRRRQRVAELHESQRQRIATNKGCQSTTHLGSDDMTLISNWMRHTNWATTFAGADRRLLLMLTERPTANVDRLRLSRDEAMEIYSSAEDEDQLTTVEKAVDHFFNRCEDTARNTDHSI